MAGPYAGVLIDSSLWTTPGQAITIAQAAYFDNIGYSEGNGNITWAQAFRRACLILQQIQPATSSQDGVSLSRNKQILWQAALEKVERWLQANDSMQNQGGVIVGDTRMGRW